MTEMESKFKQLLDYYSQEKVLLFFKGTNFIRQLKID